LMEVSRKKGAGYFVLFDPEGRYDTNVEKAVLSATEGGADAILVGGSSVASGLFDDFTKAVKSKTDLPVIVFPGNAEQLSEHADAVFFLSLVSGRNPRYLIEEHVKAAPVIKRMELETIPVAYMIIDSGGPTSVALESKTTPLARDDLEGAVAHAMAGKYLGMSMIYMDAGSGARLTIPEDLITRVKREAGLPLIVGGGIVDPEEASRKVDSGADFIVTGNTIEVNPGLIAKFAKAVHKKK
jgi:phosphoglycerol geranylgeranyltransferase